MKFIPNIIITLHSVQWQSLTSVLGGEAITGRTVDSCSAPASSRFMCRNEQ